MYRKQDHPCGNIYKKSEKFQTIIDGKIRKWIV